MTVNISFEQIKKVAAVLLLAGNLFAIGAAVNYTLWRHRTVNAFALLDFDMQDRLPQIRARLLAKQAEQAAAAAKAAQQLGEAGDHALNGAPATPPTTVPPKK